MDFFHKNQTVILVIVLLGGAFYAYSAFFKVDSTMVVTPDDLTAQAVGAEVIDLQNRISSVRLKQSIFDSTLFNRLMDFSQPIPEQPTGRTNPYSPIGFD
jgi:hypothetical protein